MMFIDPVPFPCADLFFETSQVGGGILLQGLPQQREENWPGNENVHLSFVFVIYSACMCVCVYVMFRIWS